MSQPLPPHWEQMVDQATGRPYYVNHETKTTSWEHPGGAAPSYPPAQVGQPAAGAPMAYAAPAPAQGYPPQQPQMISMQPMAQPAQPGGVMMAPAVVEVQGCPPGLEHLAYLDNFYIKQKVEMLEVFTGLSTENKYHVLNPAFQQIFYAKEDSNFCARACCGPLRPFILKISDNSGREIIHIDRPYSFSSPWMPFGLPINFCLLQKMTILSPLTGEVFGSIKQNWEFCAPTFNLEDANGSLIGVMRAPLCVCNCGNDIDFPIEKDGQELALIAHKWGGFIKEVYTNADDYHVKFPITMPPQHKAVVMAACFLVDFMFFEQKQNNNNN